MTNELFIKCSCGAEGLNLVQDDETGDVFAAFWYHNKHNMPIMHKLRWCWRVLKGEPYPDEIVIDKAWLPLIIDHLKAMQHDASRIK